MLVKSMFLLAALFTISACSFNQSTQHIAKDQDPRVGKSHKQICNGFALKSWDHVSNDSRGIVIQTQNNRFYKLRVMGDCNPRTAQKLAALENWTGNCLSVGDRVKTNTDYRGKGGQACTIMKIYDWSPDALQTAPNKDSSTKQSD